MVQALPCQYPPIVGYHYPIWLDSVDRLSLDGEGKRT